MKTYLRWIAFSSICFLFVSCSSAKKKDSVHLSELIGKKIALVSIDGEPTAKKIVEVALINQLVTKGTFILISKQDVESARLVPEQDPTDWKGIAKRAGADYALQVEVKIFDAQVHEGYSEETVIDTQLAEEMGTDGKTQQVYKVKSLEGHVLVQLRFTRLADNDTQTEMAEGKDRVEANQKNSAIHLPPQLRFLENISNKAFRDFFDRYN